MSAATSPSITHQGDPRSAHRASVGQVYPTDPAQRQSDRNAHNRHDRDDREDGHDRHEPKKRSRPRGHRRRRRRQSFAAPAQLTAEHDQNGEADLPEGPPQDVTATSASPTDTKRSSAVYRLGQVSGNLSESSLDSQELLDHR